MSDEGSVTLQIDGRPRDVDATIAPIVAALNAAGTATVASCSGHGHRPGNIALRDGREIIIVRSFEEARRIDRLFPLDINGEPTEARQAGLHEARKRLQTEVALVKLLKALAGVPGYDVDTMKAEAQATLDANDDDPPTILVSEGHGAASSRPRLRVVDRGRT